MQDMLEHLRTEGLALIEGVSSLAEAEKAKVALMGRKGTLTLQLRGLKDLSAAERPAVGAALNRLKTELEGLLEARKISFEEAGPPGRGPRPL